MRSRWPGHRHAASGQSLSPRPQQALQVERFHRRNSSGDRAILWFCATGKSGLGHLRRVTNIAKEVRRLEPNGGVGLLTNAPPKGLPEAELAVFSDIAIQARADMGGWLQDRSHLRGVVVDTAVIEGLERLSCPLALVLRETPSDRLTRFCLPHGRVWDRIIVPNPAGHWMPDPALVPSLACHAVGWIYRATPPARHRLDRPTVLIATGGGGTQETAAAVRAMLEPVIAAARALAPNGFDVIQALGPRAPVGARLEDIDGVVDPGGDLNSHFALADVVVSTAGYNSVLELAALDVPAMLLAIPRSIDDQDARARLWGPRLGCCLDADTAAAAAWLARTATARQRRRPWDLGPSGVTEAARLLLDAAG